MKLWEEIVHSICLEGIRWLWVSNYQKHQNIQDKTQWWVIINLLSGAAIWDNLQWWAAIEVQDINEKRYFQISQADIKPKQISTRCMSKMESLYFQFTKVSKSPIINSNTTIFHKILIKSKLSMNLSSLATTSKNNRKNNLNQFNKS